MNWHQVEGHWAQCRGKVREQWGKFFGSEDTVAAGKRDQLMGLMQSRYGAVLTRDESPRRVLETSSDA